MSNAGGLPGRNQPDYVASLGLSSYVHEHSRRLALDVNYDLLADFYSRGTLPTQISNNLQAVGNADLITNYLSLGAKAFAQPILISDVGIVTADNRLVPNGFRNSYGYYINPDLKFDLGEFAKSETLPSFGQVFFTDPDGALNFPVIPGLNGPEDTTSRSLTERISSGPYFERLNWNLVGSFNETDRSQSLLSEKAGIANLRYAVSYEFSLLATGGYDAISNSTPLSKNVSGPVALGGFGLDFGKDFSLQIEAGEKYNSASYFLDFRYNLSPSAAITASANDYVQTPEGQLLNNLTNLTARPDGSLGYQQDVLGNGSPSSLSSFNLQSQSTGIQDQNVSRYQVGTISFAEDLERNHFNLSASVTRRTILSGFFFGPQATTSWTAQGQYGRDLTPLLRGTLLGSYSEDNELGGEGRTFQLQSQLSYQLSRQTSIYVGVQYFDRTTSSALQALSPFTGDLTDIRATLGVSHTL